MRRTTLLIVALTSTTLLALEIMWTRLFSAEFFYTYAFLILSLAIMGLGLGALALRLFPGLNREGALGTFLSLTGLLGLAGPPVVFLLNVDFSILFNSWATVLKLVAVAFLLSATYFCGGLALGTLFKRNHAEMPRVYMADLLGEPEPSASRRAGCSAARRSGERSCLDRRRPGRSSADSSSPAACSSDARTSPTRPTRSSCASARPA